MAATTERDIVSIELRWAAVVGGVVVLIFGAILWAALAMGVNPPSNGEVIDPKTLHLSNEFTEANLGTKVEANGQITSRIVAAQFQFTPSCVVLPADRPVTLRFPAPTSSTACWCRAPM